MPSLGCARIRALKTNHPKKMQNRFQEDNHSSSESYSRYHQDKKMEGKGWAKRFQTSMCKKKPRARFIADPWCSCSLIKRGKKDWIEKHEHLHT